jgi:hypothetical protein
MIVDTLGLTMIKITYGVSRVPADAVRRLVCLVVSGKLREPTGNAVAVMEYVPVRSRVLLPIVDATSDAMDNSITASEYSLTSESNEAEGESPAGSRKYTIHPTNGARSACRRYASTVISVRWKLKPRKKKPGISCLCSSRFFT